MVDLYQDFAYATVTADVAAIDTTVAVDDVSTFPSNTLLAKADLWAVFDSALTHPNTFELVRVVSVDATANTLQLSRGQEGTTALAHPQGAVLKSPLTAEMLVRVRTGPSGSALPAADTDLFRKGDRFYHDTEHRSYVFTGSAWEADALPGRTTTTAVTSSLAPGVTDSTTTVALAQGYRLYSIATSRKARVRLYGTTAQRSADLARAQGADPASTAGVMLDYVTAAASTVYTFGFGSGVIDGISLAAPPSAVIPMSVTNNDSSTGTISVTLVWIRTE